MDTEQEKPDAAPGTDAELAAGEAAQEEAAAPSEAAPDEAAAPSEAVPPGAEPEAALEAPAVDIREGTLVVEGVLSGVLAYAVRPAPATGYCARRVRARTFRAAALGEVMAQRVCRSLGLTVLISNSGRFLLAGPADIAWEQALAALQREFDAWLFQHVLPAGDLQCDLAGAVCRTARLPLEELAARRAERRLRPLEGALRAGSRWNVRAFILPAGPRIGLCTGCVAAAAVRRLGDESLCDDCAAEGEIGERLAGAERAWLCAEQQADLAGPGLGLKFAEPALGGPSAEQPLELRLDTAHWPLLRRLPSPGALRSEGPSEQGAGPLDFEDLAARGGGRKLLGCLRVMVDGAAAAFSALEGDPARVLALGRRLHGFFGEHLHAEIAEAFPLVYPVWSGGDDTLLIGPWQHTLDLAVHLRRRWQASNAGSQRGGQSATLLTLSAGFAPAPAVCNIRAACDQASEQLACAVEAGGDRIQAFGSAVEWPRAGSLIETGKALGEWLERGAISPAWLGRLADLRRASDNREMRWRSQLESAARAHIKHRQAREWAARLPAAAAKGDSDWKWMEFLARYAALSQSPRDAARQG